MAEPIPTSGGGAGSPDMENTKDGTEDSGFLKTPVSHGQVLAPTAFPVTQVANFLIT